MKRKYFGGYLSLRQMLYVIVSVISVGILFVHIPIIVKTIVNKDADFEIKEAMKVNKNFKKVFTKFIEVI